jgi:hypothetical protein
MLPPGEVFGAGVDPPHKDVGTSIVGDLRGRSHLEEVPVIFLTNYPSGDDVDELKGAYNRVEIVSKRTVPSAFTKIVQRTIAEIKVQQKPPNIPDDEYPDVAPYHITASKSGRRIRVYFERCTLSDGAIKPVNGFNETWALAPIFDYWLTNEATCHRVHKLKCVDDPPVGVIGLYWSGSAREDQGWYRNVLFVAAPWVQHGSEQRQFTGVGEVMIARYLREWLWRNELPPDVDLDPSLFGEYGVEIEGATGGNRFLEEIHFNYDANRKLYRIDRQNAFNLLDRVTRYTRIGRRAV